MKYLLSMAFLCLLLSCQKTADQSAPTISAENNVTVTNPPPTADVTSLPVIFHIIHRGESVGSGDNVSYSEINRQLALLNNNFRNLSFGGGSVDIKMQFRLATVDPSGNTLQEAGVHRIYYPNYTYIPRSSNATETVLKSNMWNPKQYINVWVCDTEGSPSGGRWNWSILPVMPADHRLCNLNYVSGNAANWVPDYADGIVLSNTVFTPNSAGVTLTHEMGHYFGLLHVFSDNSCDDDCLDDTYNYNRSTYNANPSSSDRYLRNTCAGATVEADNYMDYYYQRIYRFTPQQKARMREVLTFGLNRAEVQSSDARMRPAAVDTVGFYPHPQIVVD